MARPLRSTSLYRCQGSTCQHHPILGAFQADGSFLVLKDSLQLQVSTGSLRLSCRSCGATIAFTIPLAANTAEYIQHGLVPVPELAGREALAAS